MGDPRIQVSLADPVRPTESRIDIGILWFEPCGLLDGGDRVVVFGDLHQRQPEPAMRVSQFGCDLNGAALHLDRFVGEVGQD